MGTFNMHIAISKKLKETFSFGNDFILGAVLPDLYKVLLKNRALTHFEKKVGKEYLPDIEKFCTEYKDQKSEITYGYLVHLVQDKIWFSQYRNKRYIEELEGGKYYRYYKDNTIHSEEEFILDFYTDYAIFDKYIMEKYLLNRKENNDTLKKCVLKNKSIKEKEQLIRIIDTRMIDYSTIYDINKPITFLTKKDLDDYYKEALLESEKILKKFIEK